MCLKIHDESEPTYGFMVMRVLVSPAYQGLSPKLDIGACILLDLFQNFQRCTFSGEDVSVDYEVTVVISSSSRCYATLVFRPCSLR